MYFQRTMIEWNVLIKEIFIFLNYFCLEKIWLKSLLLII